MKIVNQTETNNLDLYVYGEIVDERWWESDVDASDFREAFDTMNAGDTLNIYMNSGGGSVFTAVSICAIIDRLKAKGVVVNGFIDGLSASACTFIAMACDTLTAYKSSMMMIHKPMSICYGNANDLAKTIEVLNEIEESTMMPLYESKAKIDSTEIRTMINNETWLTAEEMSEAFDIEIVESSEKLVAMDRTGFSNYMNIPEVLKAEEEKKKTEEEPAEKETEESSEESSEESTEEPAEEESSEETEEESEEESEEEEETSEESTEEPAEEDDPEKKAKPEPIDYTEFENRIRKAKE